ncbi:MAG: DUF892 family protein [Verrucomicrobiota bacterium]
MKTKAELIDWLRDAYAMEKAMTSALQKQVNNQKLPLEARQLASNHLTETEAHAEAVAVCLHELGTDTSMVKNAIAQGAEYAKGVSTMLAGDEHVKDVIAAYTSEHFEIACYTALATAASHLGYPEIERTCRAILKEELRMAEKLQAGLPAVIQAYLLSD